MKDNFNNAKGGGSQFDGSGKDFSEEYKPISFGKLMGDFCKAASVDEPSIDPTQTLQVDPPSLG